MAEAFILGAVRSPIGRFRGGLRDIRSDDLLGQVIAKLVQRTAIAGDSIDDVICGCANQAGEDNRNVARMALLLAGLPQSVPGVTVNRLCGSGLEAAGHAARAVKLGEADMMIAGGRSVEGNRRVGEDGDAREHGEGWQEHTHDGQLFASSLSSCRRRSLSLRSSSGVGPAG